MARKKNQLPMSESNIKIRKAATKLSKMPMADRIQLMVKAKLISQEEADKAKGRLSEPVH